jgi:ABC-type phosphate transport system substrate-binding protein
MTLSDRVIGAGIGATLLLAASLAVANTTSAAATQTTPQADQQRSETQSQGSDQIDRMVENCTSMMANWSR